MTDIIAQTGPDHPAPVILHALARPFASDVIRAAVPHGRTVAEILTAQGLLRQAFEASVWVDDWHIPPENWHRVRPGPGRTLSVRVLPAGGGGGGKSVLRIVATIAIMYAAFQLGGPLAEAVFHETMAAGAVEGASAAAVSAAHTALAASVGAIAMTGSLLLNALMPIPKARVGQMEQLHSIGASNQAKPYGLVPVPLGTVRWAPPYAARPYTELVGTDQYVRILFDLGPGPLSIDQASMRLGDTKLSDYSDVELEIREGRADDAPITLMPGRVLEIGAGSGLPAGVMEAKNGWIIRTLDQEADELSLDFSYPAGIWRQTSSGKRKTHTAGVQIAYAPEDSEDWQPFPGGTEFGHFITAQSESEIRVSYRVAVPRGRYKVRALRAVDHTGDSKYVDQVTWTAARAQLNESPVTPRVPHAFIAMRVRASGQLSGAVSDFNLITTRVVPDWDGSQWVERATRNPASLALWVLRGSANQRPYADAKIDWPAWQDFHAACAAMGRTYDSVLESAGTVFDAVRQICAVGRGQFTIRDTLLSVMRDRQQETPVALISPRNSRNFSLTRVFADIPHALRVRFKDASADYQTAERLVFDDGYDETNATLYEVLDLPGVTNADLAWKDGRYHLAQLRLRPAIYEVEQDFEHLVVQRGDRVDLQHDVMLTGLSAGRVKAITDNRLLLELDELCPMQAGRQYLVRLRTAGWQVLDLPVVTAPGEQQVLSFTNPVPGAVAVGDLFTFGEAGAVTVPAIVKSIRPGADLSAKLELVDYAAGIYGAEQGVIPPYDSGIRVDRLPAITGLTGREVLVWQNGVQVSALSIAWERAADTRVDGYSVQLRDPTGIWSTVTPSRPTGHDVTPASLGLWAVRVQAIAADGRRGDFADLGVMVDGVPDYLPPAGLTAVEASSIQADGSVQPAIRVTWQPADDTSLLSMLVRWCVKGESDWQQTETPWGTAQMMLAPVRQPAVYELQAASGGTGGVRSEWSEMIEVTVAGGITGARVAGLELFGQGLDTTWEGRDVRLVWRGVFPDTGVELANESYGAGTGIANPYFLGYVVRVHNALTGALLRQEPPQQAAEYIYRYDDNVRDGGPRRALRIAVSIAPKIGAEIGTASIEVSNPAPPAVAPQVRAGVGAIFVDIPPVTDLDHAGYLVWLSKQAGFDPATTQPAYRGPQNFVALDKLEIGTWYIRAAAYDAFGEAGLAISGEVPVELADITLDKQPPATPTGLVLESSSSMAESGEQLVTLVASWDRAGEADFLLYEVQIREGNGNWVDFSTGLPETGKPRLSWPARPATAYAVRLRGVDRSANASAYCAAVAHTTTRDNVPPGSISGLTAEAGLRSAILRWTNPVDADLDIVEIWRAEANDRTNAARVGAVRGAAFADAGLTPGQSYYYWLRALDTSSNAGVWQAGPTNGLAVSIQRAIADDIADAQLNTAKFATGIQPVGVVSSLPAVSGYKGPSVVFLTSDSKLYRLENGTWTAAVPATDVTGQITAGQIGAGAISATKFAAGIQPVGVVSSLPAAAGYSGPSVVFLTGDGKLYRLVNGGWTAAVPAADIAGQISATQISDAAISTAKLAANAVTANNIAAGTITANNIAAGAITAGKIAAGAVAAEQIAAGAITATKIVAKAIGADQIDAGAITAEKIAVGAVTANAILANSITAGQIKAGAIGADQIAAKAIGAEKIAVGAITAEKVVAGAITTDKIATNAITAEKIVAGSITGDHISTNTALPGEITVKGTGVSIGVVTANAATGAQDPVVRINAGETKIDPGRILISGNATLADWRSGGDSTLINGGAISANSISANKLTIGNRGVQVDRFDFQVNGNVLSWGVGRITYITDAGLAMPVDVLPGSYTYSSSGGDITYIYWPKGSRYLENTKSVATAMGSDNLVLGTYYGGTNWTETQGRTVISGDRIQTGAVSADKISVNSLAAISANLGTVNAGTINAGVAFLGTLQANQITAGNITASELRLGAAATGQRGIYLRPNDDGSGQQAIFCFDGTRRRAEMFSNGSSAGFRSWDSSGKELFNSEGLADNTVKTSNALAEAMTIVRSAEGRPATVTVQVSGMNGINAKVAVIAFANGDGRAGQATSLTINGPGINGGVNYPLDGQGVVTQSGEVSEGSHTYTASSPGTDGVCGIVVIVSKR